MSRKIIIYPLSIIMAWMTIAPAYANPAIPETISVEDLQQHFPQARIIHVSPKDYPLLAKRLHQQGYKTRTTQLQLAQNTGHVSMAIDGSNPPSPARNDCRDDNTPPSDSDASLRVMVDFSDGMLHHGGNDEGAIIMFIIVGTILVVAWSLYIFKYIYDVTTGLQPCGKWSELVLTSSNISTSFNQYARFSGLRYSMGFREGQTDVGIALELGHSNILLTEISSLQLQGRYWLMGPTLRWPLSPGHNPHYLHMNFMAGTTDNNETGFISNTTMGIRFGIGNNFNLGFSWGALNINLDNKQGIISERKQYHYLYGINMGYQF